MPVDEFRGKNIVFPKPILCKILFRPIPVYLFLLFLPFFGRGKWEKVYPISVSVGGPPHRKRDFFHARGVSFRRWGEASKGNTISHKRSRHDLGEKGEDKNHSNFDLLSCHTPMNGSQNFFSEHFLHMSDGGHTVRFFKVAGT